MRYIKTFESFSINENETAAVDPKAAEVGKEMAAALTTPEQKAEAAKGLVEILKAAGVPENILKDPKAISDLMSNKEELAKYTKNIESEVQTVVKEAVNHFGYDAIFEHGYSGGGTWINPFKGVSKLFGKIVSFFKKDKTKEVCGALGLTSAAGTVAAAAICAGVGVVGSVPVGIGLGLTALFAAIGGYEGMNAALGGKN